MKHKITYKTFKVLFIILLLSAYYAVKLLLAYEYNIDYKRFLLPSPNPVATDFSYFNPYLEFLNKIYLTMQDEYYLPVSEEIYNKFKEDFKNNVLIKLKDTKNPIQEIKYWGAGALVSKLKDKDDIFSNFYPPRVAEKFKSDVLGYELGIGIRGRLTKKGYLIEHVEFRSLSYKNGIRPNDIILKINDSDVLTMKEEEIQNALYPPLGAIVKLEVFFAKINKIKVCEIEVIQFFKETLSSVPTGIDKMFYVKINQFNQSTSDDLESLISSFLKKNMETLIIDLRGNGGGPPLAAMQISGIFFDPDKDLFYFQRKNRPKTVLKSGRSNVHYEGEIAILIDQNSGSASELFAGTMKSYGRAILIGSKSAGKTFLKSMFNFEDNSMLLLVTSPAYLFDGQRYDPKGLKPDFLVEENVELFHFIEKCVKSYYEN